MGRGLAERPSACVEHPHRPAADTCDDCRQPFCAACFLRDGPLLRCRGCRAALPVREAAARRRRNPLHRLRLAIREHRASVVAGGVITAVLLLLAASAGAGVLGQSTREQMAEPIDRAVRARALLSGGPTPTAAPPGRPPPPTPIPSLAGSPEVLFGPAGEGLAALADRRAGPDAPAWRSAPGRPGADVRLTTGAPVLAGRVLFALSASTPPETWARDVEVWVSADPEDPGGVLAGRWALAPTTEPQVFAFPRTTVRAVRLRVLTNQGRAASTSLAEFALLPAGG
jgi:hypothetical protein